MHAQHKSPLQLVLVPPLDTCNTASALVACGSLGLPGQVDQTRAEQKGCGRHCGVERPKLSCYGVYAAGCGLTLDAHMRNSIGGVWGHKLGVARC